MLTRVRFRNCIHQGTAGATEELILAAIRGDPFSCPPGAPAAELSQPAMMTIFIGLARYLGLDAFKQGWLDFQRLAPGRIDPAGFPDFLAAHRYGRERADLVDLARLDLAVHLAGLPAARPSLGHCCLPPSVLADHPDLQIVMQPNWQYLKSNWPIYQYRDRLLQRPAGEARGKPPRLATAWLNILPVAGEIEIRELVPARFHFEAALSRGRPLRAAGLQAAEFDAAFEPLAALDHLIAAGAIADVNLHPETTA